MADRIPGVESYEGKLYEFPETPKQEVFTELEVRSVWANEHHRGVEQSLGSALDHAIQAGEHLAAVRDSFTGLQIRDGAWGRWVEKHFEGVLRTAQTYIRLYRNQDKLGARNSSRLSIDAAEKMLSEPKEALEPESNDSDVLELEAQHDEARSAANSFLVTLPGGKEVTPEEAKEFYERDFQKLAEERDKARSAKAKAQQEAEKASKQAERVEKELERRHKHDKAEFKNAVRTSFEQQLQELHARYGIEETPGIFEVDEEYWKAALANTRDRREIEILDILSDFFPAIIKMRKYSPQEAARACLNWPSEARAKEAIDDIAKWMSELSDEMQALTQKGVLRVVEGVEE